MNKSETENFLNKLTRDNRSRFLKFIAPQNRYIIKTEILADNGYADEVLPNRMVFKANIYAKLYLSIFGSSPLIIIGFLCFESLKIVSYILWGLAALLLLIFWLDKRNNKIELNKLGIIHKKGPLIRWNKIKSTHILYIDKGVNTDASSYLYVKLNDDRLLRMELTKINFTGDMFIDSTSKDEKVFGHYIERYKQQANKNW